MSKSNLGRLICGLAALIWRVSFVVMKDVLEAFPVFTLLALRFAGGSLITVPLFWKRLRHMPAGTLRHGVIIGVFLAAAYVAQTFGLARTTPGKNAFLTAVYCVLVPFIDWAWAGQKPGMKKVFAGILCIAGVGFISLQGSMSIGAGEYLSLLAGILFAFQVEFIARFAREDDPIALSVIQFVTTGVLCTAAALLTETWPASVPQVVWAQLGYLVLMATTAALLMQNIGQSMTTPASAAVLLSLESVFGAMTSLLLGREQPQVHTVIGFALVFGAVLLSVLERNPDRRKEPDHDIRSSDR